MDHLFRGTLKEILKGAINSALEKSYLDAEVAVKELWEIVDSSCTKHHNRRLDLSKEEDRKHAYRVIVESHVVANKVMGFSISPINMKLIYDSAYAIVNLQALQEQKKKDEEKSSE